MLLKDLIDRAYVTDLGTTIARFYAPFDPASFAAAVLDEGWEAREMKDRIRYLTLTLHCFLPADYNAALNILRRASPLLSSYGLPNWVFSDYVAIYGLEDWEASIAALEQFTHQISAEFAVRPFIVHDGERMLARMLAWARSDDPDLRRLASEGSRPRLPWGIALPALKRDPTPLLPILEQLKDDPQESVRRSVANNLNDIAKDNPQVVIDVLRRWLEHETPELRWIAGHALRTLVKAGHPEALALVGVSDGAMVEVRDLVISPVEIPIDGKLTLSFDIVSLSEAAQDLVIDYILYLLRANGQHTPKVWKLSRRRIAPGEVLHIQRTIHLKPVTTRRYYPGEHAVTPQINGRTFGRVSFTLTGSA